MDKSVREAIRIDETWQKFRRIVKSYVRVDLEPLFKEVKALHSSRSIRQLKIKDASPTRVQKVALEEQSYRSRIVEIVVDLQIEFNSLKQARDEIRDYLIARYGHKVKARSQADRDTVWRVFLKNTTRRLRELEDAIEIMTYLIDDLDKAGYTTTNSLKALELQIRRES